MTEVAPGYDISTEPARLDVDAIHAYLVRSYWSPGIPREVVARAVAHSLCFGAYEKSSGKQVGFTRVVTDHATFAYLCDVYVLEEHRGHGLGKAMMRAAMAHPALSGARRVMLATRDAHGLYRQHGFANTTGNTNLMEIVRPDIYGKS
ncbi:MAG TPA: GNAT family N-acetyltransferase [Steroidobacteraceae bacterium]|nr:GNAT family N-acetyltransferase [Steroidobacteraceae bacterium]